ncbi:MAG TPA: hypothetical protein VEC16_04185, partial [Alphaproteobacteria bacterium]|nr:hypothetical protein [Alphaproteobacteria bacterium]
ADTELTELKENKNNSIGQNDPFRQIKMSELERVLQYRKNPALDRRILYNDYILNNESRSPSSPLYNIVNGIDIIYNINKKHTSIN